MSDYGLIFSFRIDNGELDGIQPEQVFVLGYELGQLWEQLKAGERISRAVRIENKERVESMLALYERSFKLTFMESDRSESWLWLTVSGKSNHQAG